MLRPKKRFRFSDGTSAPISADIRLLMGFPKKRKAVITGFVEKLGELSYLPDVIAGVATAGIPFAAWLSEALKLPMVYTRKITNEQEKEKLVEGRLKGNANVLLIEDLVNHGGSAVGAVRAIRYSGGILMHCFCIFSYHTKRARERFSNANCELHPLCELEDILLIAKTTGKITQDEEMAILDWRSDPQGWLRRSER